MAALPKMYLPSYIVMIERYKDYLIHGTARVMPDSPEWRSEGTVFAHPAL
jgi:hypothetical protein